MDIKNKKYQLFILFFILLCFLTVPTNTVYAYFSDVILENVGIQLTLGSVEMDVKENNNRILSLENGQNRIQLKETIQNKGSLTGKLAYQITLSKKDGTKLNDSLSQSIKIKINNKNVKIQDMPELLSVEESNDSLTIPPEKSIGLPVEIEITSLPIQSEEINVKIEFLLMQTNGTIGEPLFHDQEAVTYTIEIEKKAEEDIDEYWPTNGWIEKGNIRYNLEKFSPIMYFSEIVGTTKIKNLNDNVIYIEILDKNGIDSTGSKDLRISATREGVSIEVNHVNRNKQHLKVTISLNEEKFKLDNLSEPMHYYGIDSIYPNKEFSLNSDDLPITLKRILLSTDYVESRLYSPQLINLFSEERKIYLAQSDQDYYNFLETPLKNIFFDDKVKVSVNMQGNNENYIQIGKDTTENAQFTLQSVKTIEKVMAGPQLTVLLTGTSGATLEVKRETQLLPTNSQIP